MLFYLGGSSSVQLVRTTSCYSFCWV
uniref:Uncharacterized protein n=1 Tax=Heterorhabditis bacteriophora TaxID=37862 RepID=A0A1I7WU43_HETBA